MRFKERSHLQNKKVQHEAASTAVETAASYPADPATVINKGSCTKQCIFCVQETAFLWKMLLSRTFIVREKSLPGWQKTIVIGLTFLLGAKEVGDFKWKPIVVNYSENPGALKNNAKSTLPVL